jgi:hypothetical protein
MPKPFFTMTFTGLAQLQLFFSLMKKAAESFGEAWVGSAVTYAPYQEFGTRLLQERPHWRVAIPEIIAEVGGDQREQNAVLDALIAREMEGLDFGEVGQIDSAMTAPMVVALKIERRVKQIITAKGIIDTGNYRASIATGPNERAAWQKSAARAKNPQSVVQ